VNRTGRAFHNPWRLALALAAAAGAVACSTPEAGMAKAAASVSSVAPVPFSPAGKGRVLEDAGFRVDYTYYAGDGMERAVILVPPTGGATFIDRRYARLLCRDGAAVYLLRDWSGMSEQALEPAVHNRLLGRAQRAIGLVANDIGARDVGILGTSVGGIHAATAVGRLQRLDAAFIVGAGAPVAAVIARSGQDTLAQWRRRRMDHYGFADVAAYEKALLDVIEWEPLLVADNARQKHLGAAVIAGDSIVPTACQRRLAAAWQPVLRLSIAGFWGWSHAAGILKTGLFHAQDIVAFFRRALTEGETGITSVNKNRVNQESW